MGTSADHDHRDLKLWDAFRKRRTHRDFEQTELSTEAIGALVEAAASAQTFRPGVRHIVVVTEPASVATLGDVVPGWVSNATAAIVLCTDVDKAAALAGSRAVDIYAKLDAGAALAHITLAAVGLGVGICTVGSFTEGAVQAVLDIPDHIRPDVVIGIGIPIRNPLPTPPRAAFQPGVHYNRFGKPTESTAP